VRHWVLLRTLRVFSATFSPKANLLTSCIGPTMIAELTTDSERWEPGEDNPERATRRGQPGEDNPSNGIPSITPTVGTFKTQGLIAWYYVESHHGHWTLWLSFNMVSPVSRNCCTCRGLFF
jgi:hypothetical protein